MIVMTDLKIKKEVYFSADQLAFKNVQKVD